VFTDMFEAESGGERHVALAAESDVVVVVPATADVLSRFATGRADDLLTATVLCARCPVFVAPAMHPSMWSHPATRRNVKTLLADARVSFVGPVDGEVASGERGEGRMAEPEEIAARVIEAASSGDLAGRHLVVTAGPTLEDIDAVRFLGNRSSGKMGFAIAERARARGARVSLVAGPVALPTPPGVERRDVRSALDLERVLSELLGENGSVDALVMAAAVSDYRPERRAEGKLKRGDERKLALGLVQNPDILAGIGRARRGKSPVLVGFAVETGSDAEIVKYARGKLQSKRVDVIVANHAAESMGRDDNRVLVVDEKTVTPLPPATKRDVADGILDVLAKRLGASTPKRRARSPNSGRAR
jgi:phosphopantothenoylcysteine decarboxylase/phosphopantothenate--cysteine ligase